MVEGQALDELAPRLRLEAGEVVGHQPAIGRPVAAGDGIQKLMRQIEQFGFRAYRGGHPCFSKGFHAAPAYFSRPSPDTSCAGPGKVARGSEHRATTTVGGQRSSDSRRHPGADAAAYTGLQTKWCWMNFISGSLS
jgi:hypothetical protein